MATQDDFPQNTSTTGVVQVGSAAKGNFETSGDTDWFAVELQAGVSYLINLLTSNMLVNQSSNFGVKMFDAAGRAVSNAMWGDTSFGMAPVLEFAPSAAGTYYIAASSFSYYSPIGAYQLSASVRQGADDFAPNSSTTGQIVADTQLAGKFEVAGDQDWIKFHADAGRHYTFRTLAAATGATPNIMPSIFEVVDAAGTVLSSAYSFDPGQSGDYYVKLVGFRAGDYNISYKISSDDYSDTETRMGVFQPGGQIAGKIDYKYDTDRFKLVSVEAGKTYSVTLTGDASDYTMAVFGADGNTLSYFEGGVGAGGVVRTFTPKADGDVFISVSMNISSKPFTAALNYALSVSSPNLDEVGNSTGTASQIAVGQNASAALQSGSDVDMFRFALDAGVTYSFALKPDSSANVAQKLTLTGADGVNMRFTDANLQYFTFTPERSGDYYAAVAADGVVSTAWRYQLTLGQPADDAGATAAGAKALAIGASVGGVLETGGGDRDWYAVQLVAGGTYFFKAESAASTLSTGGQLRLFDASGDALAATASSFSTLTGTLTYKAVQSGTYYVEMSSPYRNTGAYTLSAKLGTPDDHGGTLATASTIAAGATLQGNLEVAADQDVFKLSVEAGTTYAFKFNALDSHHQLSLALADASGKPAYFFSNSGIPADQYVFTAVETGSMYLTVAGSSGSSSYNEDGKRYTLSAIDYGIDDCGNSRTDTSASLAPGRQMQARINYAGDWDYVRVSLEAGKSYVFSMLDSKSGGGSLQLASNIYPAAFELVDGASGNTVGVARNDATEKRLSYTASTSGDYYLRVNGGGATGSYTLKSAQLSGDSAGPSLVFTSQTDGAKNVALTSTSFKFGFSESIAIDAAQVRVLDGSGKQLAFATGSTTLSAAAVADNTLAFKLLGTLAPGATYTIELPRGAVHDLAGNAHTGPTQIKFSTVALAPAATGGNDLLAGGGGKTIDGGAGIDTVMYTGDMPFRTITRVGAKTEVKYFANGGQVTDTLENVERLLLNGSTIALDVDGIGGQAYRLYRAAFHRTPDEGGLGFWIAQMDTGVSLDTVAKHFMSSTEFQGLYGAATSNSQFINLLYNNVLGRTADSGGFEFWDNAMRNGVSRETVLIHFSESPENVNSLASLIGNGFSYTPY